MKKSIIFIIALWPFYLSAAETDCNKILDLKAKKECLIMQKQAEARNNFKNFEKNNRIPYQQNF